MRRRFAGVIYFEFHQTTNAIRAERLNKALDDGLRAFADPQVEESPPGEWVEVEEALEPRSHGILVRARDGKNYLVYAYAIGPEAVARHRPGEQPAQHNPTRGQADGNGSDGFAD